MSSARSSYKHPTRHLACTSISLYDLQFLAYQIQPNIDCNCFKILQKCEVSSNHTMACCSSVKYQAIKYNIQRHHIDQNEVYCFSFYLSQCCSCSTSLNRIAMQLLPSQRDDKIDYLSLQKYNCHGMFLDWTGTSAFTTG